MPRLTETTGVRVGAGVGTGVGAGDVGWGVGAGVGVRRRQARQVAHRADRDGRRLLHRRVEERVAEEEQLALRLGRPAHERTMLAPERLQEPPEVP